MCVCGYSWYCVTVERRTPVCRVGLYLCVDVNFSSYYFFHFGFSRMCVCVFVFVCLSLYFTHYNNSKFLSSVFRIQLVTTTKLHIYWLDSLVILLGSCNLWQNLSYCSVDPIHGIGPANGHRSWFSFSLILRKFIKLLFIICDNISFINTWHVVSYMSSRVICQWNARGIDSRELCALMCKYWHKWRFLPKLVPRTYVETIFLLPVRYTEHHVCAADSQNNCCGVESNPGSFGSAPLARTHSRYALYDSLMPPLSAIFSPWVLIPFNWKIFIFFSFIFHFVRFAQKKSAHKWIISLEHLCELWLWGGDFVAIKRLLLL